MLNIALQNNHQNNVDQMPKSVNVVCDYMNELSLYSIKHGCLFLSTGHLYWFTQGAGEALAIHR